MFTDGACKSNGREGARAGFGVHVVGIPELDISGPLPTTEKQTNQRAELYGILHAFKQTEDLDLPLTIYSDS